MLWLLSLHGLQKSILDVHVCQYLQYAWYHRVREKKSKISKPSEYFHEKMAQISILHNHLTMEFVKHRRKENKRNQSIGQFSPSMLCLRCNVYALCTIHKCPPLWTYACGGTIFHVNKRDTYVDSQFDIDCLTTWTTSLFS
jgi:hypothetical protein